LPSEPNSHDTARPSRLKVWFLAARPKTLPAGIVPVLVGGALAFNAEAFYLPAFMIALLGSILIQVGTNFANDYFDYKKETDRDDRLGPTRVTQAGLVSPRQIITATYIVFGLAMIAGIYLAYRGGWPIVFIGLASIICGILYTAGPLALGYIGLADLFVLIFYGPVALAGTYYVQVLNAPVDIILAGIPFGMISTAILTVNNLRDIDSDKKSGKKSLAVRLGRGFARFEYLLMIIGAAVIALWLGWRLGKPFMALTAFYLPLAFIPAVAVLRSIDGARLNSALAQTGLLLLVYGFLFALGWLL